MWYLLLFHRNNGYTNAPVYYFIRSLTVITFMLPCIVIDLFLNNQPDALIIPILFCYKTLHVSGIFSAHQQEFSTVHSALVSFMQVLMTVSRQSQDRTYKTAGVKISFLTHIFTIHSSHSHHRHQHFSTIF